MEDLSLWTCLIQKFSAGNGDFDVVEADFEDLPWTCVLQKILTSLLCLVDIFADTRSTRWPNQAFCDRCFCRIIMPPLYLGIIVLFGPLTLFGVVSGQKIAALIITIIFCVFTLLLLFIFCCSVRERKAQSLSICWSDEESAQFGITDPHVS